MLGEAALRKVSNLSGCTDKARTETTCSFFQVESGNESCGIQGATKVAAKLRYIERSFRSFKSFSITKRSALVGLICHGSFKVERVTGRSNQGRPETRIELPTLLVLQTNEF